MDHKPYIKSESNKASTMNIISPPDTDEELDRHRFYTALTTAMNNIAGGQERAFRVLSDVEKSVAEQHKFQVRIYAIGSAFSIIWFVFSGFVGWYANRIIGNYDGMFARVERIERVQEIAELKAKPLENTPDKIDAIKARLARVEDDIEKLKNEK